MSALADRIARWLRDQLTAAGAQGLIVGLSGGVDSAVVARLSQRAAPANTLGVMLPSHSDPQDEADARLVARHFGLQTVTVALGAPYDALTHAVQSAISELPTKTTLAGAPVDDIKARMPFGNLAARLRMAALYFLANRLNRLVVGTGNRSELAIGYFTKYGDGGVDLLPLGNLVKHQVRELARALEVPASIVNRPPSAGSWAGQLDEEEIGVRYADLDAYLEKGPDAVSPAVALRVERLIRATEHKRAQVPIFVE